MLGIVRGHTCIRQVIDIVDKASSLVLEYLDDNLLDICSRKRVEGSDLKVVAQTVLQALVVLHEKGFMHTGQHSIILSSIWSYAILTIYLY